MKLPTLEDVQKNIDKLCIDRGIGQNHAELARRAELTESTLANVWKKTRKYVPFGDDLYAISRALGVTVDELLTGRPPQTEPPLRDGERELLSVVADIDDATLREIIAAVKMLILVHYRGGRGNMFTEWFARYKSALPAKAREEFAKQLRNVGLRADDQ